MTKPAEPTNVRRVSIDIRGVVQGVGFRPFVFNAATQLGLAGWVRNEAGLVRIEVEGPSDRLDRFLAVLQNSPPPQSRIESITVTGLPHRKPRMQDFSIRNSIGGAPLPAIPADSAVCARCTDELTSPDERRRHYPFTNCTDCGPRWSILKSPPYDRSRTSMATFPMCPDCETEYLASSDRRFHAQPIACPACGPSLALLDPAGRVCAERDAALHEAAEAVRRGRIVALKGLGGFQLVVDATDAAGVQRLRERKHRLDKPFAVMVASVREAMTHCWVSAEAARAMTSPASPILLLPRRVRPIKEPRIVDEVAPGNPFLGIMQANTPLHYVLLQAVGRPIVCTSGNLSEEPMAVTNEEALERLANIADAFLVHNRDIVRPVDDSVMRIGVMGPQIIRRARGYVPLPIRMNAHGPTVLAVGGHLKNTVALGLESQAVLSSHVGDLDHPRSLAVHQEAIEDLLRFFQATPKIIACDLHPDYASTQIAERLAAQWRIPLLRVQHHHAHTAACMAEHRHEGSIVGLAWDGVGYGPDGTLWGGEALQCEGTEYRRLARLRTFPLPGGDVAAREPRRAAIGLLYEIFGNEARRYAPEWFSPQETDVLFGMMERPGLCPRTGSVGRLFDAVAALCGLPPVVSFEGRAAMALEHAAAAERSVPPYPAALSATDPAVADWEPMVREILADRASGVPVRRISARFHRTLAEIAIAMVRLSGENCVALTGGCFQNALLEHWIASRLGTSGYRVLTHRHVPPGDGGIALGQAWLATQTAARSS